MVCSGSRVMDLWLHPYVTDLWLHPNIISLGLLVVCQLKKTPLAKCKPGNENHVVGAALMLAERFVEDDPYAAELWA
jgi:hypothetical protein